MSDTYGSGFGFGSYAKEEAKEELIVHEMAEEPADDEVHEFVAEEPASEKPAAVPVPKYEISQRPLRAKKRR